MSINQYIPYQLCHVFINGLPASYKLGFNYLQTDFLSVRID